MTDTYSADIKIGGRLKRSQADRLWDAIEEDGAFDTLTDQLFDADNYELAADGILRLYDTEASWGHFDAIEAACKELGLSYVRWSEDGDKQVFDGKEAHDIDATPDGDTVLTAKDLERFDTIADALVWMKLMDGDPPALELLADVEIEDTRT